MEENINYSSIFLKTILRNYNNIHNPFHPKY